jgi:flavin reductase (DIM6/NTAB) family NADH-FMN oxidoreductase RutF
MREEATKIDFPVYRACTYLEPGPILLVSSQHDGERNVMTLGWHVVMDFSPSLAGCMISAGNHSFDLIWRSCQCVLNVPTEQLVDTVVGIGNCSGRDMDKFERFGLVADPATRVVAPLIRDCFAAFECELVEDSLVDRYNFFIFEIVKAHVASKSVQPRTLHYTGDGDFMVAGKIISRRHLFKPSMLGNGRHG